MFGIIFIFAVSSVGVQSHLRAPPGRHPMSPTLNQAVMRAEPSLRKYGPCSEIITITSQTTMPNVVPNLPVATTGIPFVTELPSCPDLCFNDILSSPLGCLGSILNVYGAATDIIKPDLPAASPVSASSPPFSKLLPPALFNDCGSLFAKRVPIPPPFI